MEILKWFTPDECKAEVEKYVKKFDDGTLVEDETGLFLKALFGSIYKSKEEEDDEDKQELWENISDDLEEYQSLTIFVEVREQKDKWIFSLKPEEIKLGLFDGEYTEDGARKLNPSKHVVWMDWTPACQLKIMKGNPNTDPEFFSGDCTVKGSTRIAAKPRAWIYDMFVFIDREVE